MSFWGNIVKAVKKITNPPLSGFITGKKSFKDSLRTDGTPLEQSINKGILKAVGQGPAKKTSSSSSSKSSSSADTFAAFLEAERKRRAGLDAADAESAAKKAADDLRAQQLSDYNAKLSSAQAEGEKGSALARSQLQNITQNQMQTDSTNQTAQQNLISSAGQQNIGGGGFNPMAAMRQAMTGSVGTYGGLAQAQGANPAATAQAATQATNETGSVKNRFSMPDTSKVFGGS